MTEEFEKWMIDQWNKRAEDEEGRRVGLPWEVRRSH